MTILDPSKQKTQKGKNQVVFFLVIVLIVGGILGYKYTTGNTFDEHSVIDDLNGLVYAFDSIAHGDIYGFFDGVLDSIVVIGLFMVMFALIHFLISVTMKHVFSTKSVQLTISLAITAYAFIDHKIYNFLISLNAFMVGFLVFCAFVIMLWGFGKNSYKNLQQSQHELNKARLVARQQYDSKGYVDDSLAKHIRRLQREISEDRRKYQKELNEKDN